MRPRPALKGATLRGGIEVALDLQELVYEVNTFLNAASMIKRLGKT